ncbi:MAG: 1-(5-phosphoribosyl)-5-[(5-phosphoribosylamino)methylideneamino]imidazole-4-carboxamide isomerase [Dongiaceae bacterium]
MILYPAIDIKGGKCVRLLRGDHNRVTVFNENPAQQAKAFAEAGFKWLHVVDMDGAQNGRMTNEKAVEEILKTVKVPVQVGGGIRTLPDIEKWLEKGAKRVMLGTMALQEPNFVREACRHFPDRIIVSIDTRYGKVAINGWSTMTDTRALDLALRLDATDIAAFIYTDIDHDGAAGGLNIDAIVDFAWGIAKPVIAAGGISGLADLEALRDEQVPGIIGAIMGRALYDGRIDPAQALKVFK